MRAGKPMRPVRIAVVGHTNTGKTSLMRTLARDTGFGEVSSRPSTTRHVEGLRLLADGEVLVELFDTPGMEDPIALLEVLEGIAQAGERLDGPARVERFLAGEASRRRFEQEAKVLRQLLASDAGFYVVDARDPVLAKHRDELEILGSCAVPLLPVLNFVRSPDADEGAWREALSRLGLHAVVRFDTVAPERDGERRLYEKLGTVLDAWQPALERLIECREREAQERHHAAQRLVAGLLIDVAAARLRIETDHPAAEQHALGELSDRVRRHEQRCVDALLALYRFRADDVDGDALPLTGGRWEHDLFHPETVRDMGVKLGTGAAAGAAAGVGVDLMFGGMTLGAAAALGALAGGGVQAVRHFGERVLGVLTGKRDLAVDDAILRLLALRELSLVAALEARGHAAVAPLRHTVEGERWREGELLPTLARARGHPEWSDLLGKADEAARERAVEALVAEIEARKRGD